MPCCRTGVRRYNAPMRRLLPLLLLSAALLGCPPGPNPPPGSDICAAGEQNLLKLECKDDRARLIGGPNLHGVPWAAICRENKTNGVDMKPACIAMAKSCAEVDTCR
jgi:hypothetical protein